MNQNKDLLNIPKVNIVLINTSEDYYSLMNYWIENFQKQINSTCNYRFTADRYFDYGEIHNIINNGNLFNDVTYIEVNYKSKPTVEQQKELIKLIPQIHTNIFLLITTDKLNKTDISSQWVSSINNSGTTVSLGAIDVTKIVLHQLQKSQLTIDNDAMTTLLELNQGNLDQLMQETKKLCLLYPINHKISLDEIKKHSFDNAIYNIYQLRNSYLEGNLSNSILILNNIYQKPEDAILIQWLLADDIKKLITLKAKLKQNMTFSKIAGELKIWGSNSNLYQLAERRLSYTSLVATLDEISILDLTVKGIINCNILQQLIKIIDSLCIKKI